MLSQHSTNLTIDLEQEEDGRWIAEVLELPGVLVYGTTQEEAIAHVQALALRVIADKIEHGEFASGLSSFAFFAAWGKTMSQWPATKAREVLSALERIGWKVKRQTGSHKILERSGWDDYVFPFRDSDEIGAKMLSRIAKKTGLKPEDL